MPKHFLQPCKGRDRKIDDYCFGYIKKCSSIPLHTELQGRCKSVAWRRKKQTAKLETGLGCVQYKFSTFSTWQYHFGCFLYRRSTTFYYRVVVIRAHLQGQWYTVRNVVDWRHLHCAFSIFYQKTSFMATSFSWPLVRESFSFCTALNVSSEIMASCDSV